MATRPSRFTDFRPFILWGSLLGLGMVAIIASVGLMNHTYWWAAVVSLVYGWPFTLGLLALVLPLGSGARRLAAGLQRLRVLVPRDRARLSLGMVGSRDASA